MSKILKAEKNGPSYYKVTMQFASGEIQDHWMHESEYKLKVFEEKNIGSEITQGFLDEYKDLVHDVEYHNQCMEESD
jgi:hypothetical protein